MLFIDFSCLSQPYTYSLDHFWKKFWIDMAILYPNMPVKLVAEENKISFSALPANCEIMTIRLKKFPGLFAAGKAFPKAVKALMDVQNAIWITNQMTHILDEYDHQLLWIDDLEWLKFPQWQRKSREKIKLKDWQKGSKRINRYASFSKNYADVLNSEMEIPKNQISSVFPYYQNETIPASWSEKESIKTQYTGGDDFFVFVGDIHQQHHIISILKAYSIFKKWQRSSMKLVILGYTTEHTASILETVESYKHRENLVIITDPDEGEKLKILSASYACVYTAESISFPATMPDAMKSGIPLIVSDIPNMKEWGLDHVLYANAADETQIAEKMILLFKDETLRTRLIENATLFATSGDQKSSSFFEMMHSLFPANFAATIK